MYDFTTPRFKLQDDELWYLNIFQPYWLIHMSLVAWDGLLISSRIDRRPPNQIKSWQILWYRETKWIISGQWYDKCSRDKTCDVGRHPEFLLPPKKRNLWVIQALMHFYISYNREKRELQVERRLAAMLLRCHTHTHPCRDGGAWDGDRVRVPQLFPCRP